MTQKIALPDIKPQTPVASLNREQYLNCSEKFNIDSVAKVTGFSKTFIRKVCGTSKDLSVQNVIALLDQDAFSETFIPRSKIISYLLETTSSRLEKIDTPDTYSLHHGNALDLISKIPHRSVQCVVTSSPYWGMRIYKDSFYAEWADGDKCPYGHEQTPEGFIRHSVEILAALYDVLDDTGSIWWNVMDTFNTRTQIRSNASEALKAMQGKEKISWNDHECRRYSAGHSYLKDGEQCMIPAIIAERASRMGYYVKSVITWAKTSTTPEPQDSRVSRNLEYILHLSKERTPKFSKDAYLSLPPAIGGKNINESNKLSDVWNLSTSSGRDGHGAQFPIALPGRCIALSTSEHDLVLDPFVGAGSSGIAAISLNRKFIGIDISKEYLGVAERKIAQTNKLLILPKANSNKDRQPAQANLLQEADSPLEDIARAL